MKIAILQPSYLPWLGYFDQMDSVDLFVFYDDVQYDRGGWRNRNRIKTAAGVRWLTVPVSSGANSDSVPLLDQMEVSGTRWKRKHIETVRQAYAAAPGLDFVITTLEDLLARDTTSLVETAIGTVQLFADALDISTPTVQASQLGVVGTRNARLISICQELGATQYLSGAAARSYLDPIAFADAGIELLIQDYAHPVYRQLHGVFEPYLSILDLVANEPRNGLQILRSGRRANLISPR